MKKIVIVEDDENIANAEKLILQDSFEVHSAKEGHEGLELIRKIKPDLAILDIMLPGIDGFELCKRLRADEELKDLKILMVTAKDQDKDEAEGMERGADDYIMKPFEPDELLHVVNQVLNN